MSAIICSIVVCWLSRLWSWLSLLIADGHFVEWIDPECDTCRDYWLMLLVFWMNWSRLWFWLLSLLGALNFVERIDPNCDPECGDWFVILIFLDESIMIVNVIIDWWYLFDQIIDSDCDFWFISWFCWISWSWSWLLIDKADSIGWMDPDSDCWLVISILLNELILIMMPNSWCSFIGWIDCDYGYWLIWAVTKVMIYHLTPPGIFGSEQVRWIMQYCQR
jgi:hypothetical protein